MFVLAPEVLAGLYLLFGLGMTIRFWWLLQQSLDELRRRYPR